uniref:Putative transmembrane protein n=1 Tax=Acidianus hospitalis (strain W1) TaxID=933801 RepID=B6D947_ACIHW|nr:putative transmembrane protein [Acidianus hospitalis W1]
MEPHKNLGEKNMKSVKLPPRFIRAVIILSTIGVAIHAYDLFALGIISTEIWPYVFFKKATNSAIALSILAYAAVLAGRPLGGVVFGHFGDRLGRKFSMFWTLLISGTAMLLITLMPPIGITAIILIAVLRFIQGMGGGGNLGSSIVLSYEYAEKGERAGYLLSFILASIILGIILGVLGVLISERLESEAFLLTYGWRILTGIGAVTVILSAYLRTRIVESLDFKEVLRSGEIEKNPIKTAFKKCWRNIILITLAIEYFPVILNFLLYPYSIELMENSGYNESIVTLTFLIASISAYAMTIVGGHLADKYGWKKVVLLSAIGSLASIPVLFIHSLFALFPVYILSSIGWGAMGVIPSTFAVNLRNTSTGAVFGLISSFPAVLLIAVLPTLISIYGVTGSLIPVSIITSVITIASIMSILSIVRRDKESPASRFLKTTIGE